ncbi:uncharacterized protein [Mytilus edulis]|uniref:uncharacterized protein isoform X1 n=1 Tax=Mytilus edulis TaxID=6550 RepID=UPI0039EEDE73
MYIVPAFIIFFIIVVANISNATREEEVSYEGNHTRSSEDWREGRRIAELDVLATGLRACLKCGLPLQLGHTIDIQTYGLGGLLKVQCFNTSCMHVNSVPTGKRHDRVWDVNSKLATGTWTSLVHSGLGERQANSFLSELNIPAFSYKLVSARLREVGNVVEEVAKESTNEALEKELAAVEQKKGKLVVAVDAGWQKRGSGRAYDSKSGHCSMVGPETGKILNYSVRSKDCRVCSRAESRNESPREHACYRNWEGSSKGMEADMVIEMVKDVQSKGCTVDALVGDEDSTTIGQVRAIISNSIEKISDRRFLKAVFTLSEKNHPVLTVKIIKYLQSCFNYIIAQGEGNPEQIAKDLNALSKHPFGDHQCCSSRWCKFLSNPKTVFKSFPQIKPRSGSSLQKSLENVFEGYAKNSIKLSTVGSTQANESFNRMVSAKAPKHVHYSSSGNLNYRVAASVAQKNTGHRYLVNVNEKLGLSPGYHTQRLTRLRDYQ